jgi:hypothetical protein
VAYFLYYFDKTMKIVGTILCRRQTNKTSKIDKERARDTCVLTKDIYDI